MFDAFQINETACFFKIVKSFDRQNAFTMIRRLDFFHERCRERWANSFSRTRQIEKRRKNRQNERRQSEKNKTKRQHKRREKVFNSIKKNLRRSEFQSNSKYRSIKLLTWSQVSLMKSKSMMKKMIESQTTIRRARLSKKRRWSSIEEEINKNCFLIFFSLNRKQHNREEENNKNYFSIFLLSFEITILEEKRTTKIIFRFFFFFKRTASDDDMMTMIFVSINKRDDRKTFFAIYV
jgi:hypothetical protein